LLESIILLISPFNSKFVDNLFIKKIKILRYFR
jgi:hypothetical protein